MSKDKVTPENLGAIQNVMPVIEPFLRFKLIFPSVGSLNIRESFTSQSIGLFFQTKNCKCYPNI